MKRLATEKKKRAAKIYKVLEREYPDAHCELNHENPYQLLVATILSAQCTDVRVNIVTPGLFAKYPSFIHLANARHPQLEELIRSTGFYKNKAKNLVSCAKKVVADFQGEIPHQMDQLITLAGVGRKTANVVLGNAFNINHGIVVDTHVKRLSNLLGLTSSSDPIKIEQELIPLFPQSQWTMLSHLLIFHGRKTCKARKPTCTQCPLAKLCTSANL
jgi:endonuclease III